MPKTKTNSSAKKRFKVTSGGKVTFKRAGLRHNFQTVTSRQRRHKERAAELAPEHVPAVLRRLGRR